MNIKKYFAFNRQSVGKKRIRFPVSLKITLPYILLALLFSLVASYIVTNLVFENISERFENQLLVAGTIAADLMVETESDLLSSLRAISFTEGVAEQMLVADSEGILNIILPLAVNQRVEAIEIFNPSGQALLSMYHQRGGNIEDYIIEKGREAPDDWIFVTNVLEQIVDENNSDISNKFAGEAVTPYGRYFFVSGPIYSEDGEFAGAVIAGISIESLAQEMKRELDAEVFTFYSQQGEIIHSTFLVFWEQNRLSAELLDNIFNLKENYTYIRPVSGGSLSFSEVLGVWEVRNGETVGVIGISRGQSTLISTSNESRSTIFLSIAFFFMLVIGVGLYIASLITRPLGSVVDGIETVQSGDLDVLLEVESQDEIGVLASAFNNMVAGLKIKERMTSELNFARDIQMQLMPLKTLPVAEEKGVDLFAHIDPAREVGGDFYDFFFMDENHLCFVIADVSGKGAPGAVLMAVTKTLIKSFAMANSSPAEILTKTNKELSQGNTSAMFVTAFLGILNTQTGAVIFTNAGHNPPYIKKSNGDLVTLKNKHGVMLGPFRNIQYKEDEITLNKGDLLLMYTDGVPEAMDISSNLFSEERIETILSTHVDLVPQKLVNLINVYVSKFVGDAEQADDITMLALQYGIASSAIEQNKSNLTIKNHKDEIEFVETEFDAFSTQYTLPDGVRRKVSIVLDELLNNVISYGYEDDAEHLIDVSFELSDKHLVLTISDDGVPFDPFELDTPDLDVPINERRIGGLGIHITRNTMDEYQYQRLKNKNIVTVKKRIEE